MDYFIQLKKWKRMDYSSSDMRIVCRYKGEILYIAPDGLLYEYEAGHYNWTECHSVEEWKSEIDAYQEAISDIEPKSDEP